MRPNAVTPTGVERTFGEHQLIVSKTDLKGIITYANDVFLTVARYSEDELIGRPHSIVRHPDMPRAVFRLMWDTISTGKELFAYVKNLAADGAHYWVLAHVTPSFGPDQSIIGYHSSRRAPDRAAVAAIEPVYAQLLAAEQRQHNAAAAVEASVALLTTMLADRGQTNEEFLWSLLATAGAR
jgi:PAS domain S-box-containing protein